MAQTKYNKKKIKNRLGLAGTILGSLAVAGITYFHFLNPSEDNLQSKTLEKEPISQQDSLNQSVKYLNKGQNISDFFNIGGIINISQEQYENGKNTYTETISPDTSSKKESGLENEISKTDTVENYEDEICPNGGKEHPPHGKDKNKNNYNQSKKPKGNKNKYSPSPKKEKDMKNDDSFHAWYFAGVHLSCDQSSHYSPFGNPAELKKGQILDVDTSAYEFESLKGFPKYQNRKTNPANINQGEFFGWGGMKKDLENKIKIDSIQTKKAGPVTEYYFIRSQINKPQ